MTRASDVKAPHERLDRAAQRLRFLAGDATHGYVSISTTEVELLARLMEGMGAHWATRPIADWDIYNSTPLAALVRHIVGEEADRG